jgi:hypothetical protein
VHPRPFRSGPVAVLSCCTHRQVPQRSRNVAVPPAASPGFLPPPRVMTGGLGACRGFDLTLLCSGRCPGTCLCAGQHDHSLSAILPEVSGQPLGPIPRRPDPCRLGEGGQPVRRS